MAGMTNGPIRWRVAGAAPDVEGPVPGAGTPEGCQPGEDTVAAAAEKVAVRMS